MNRINNLFFYTTLAGLLAWLLYKEEYGVILAGLFVAGAIILALDISDKEP